MNLRCFAVLFSVLFVIIVPQTVFSSEPSAGNESAYVAETIDSIAGLQSRLDARKGFNQVVPATFTMPNGTYDFYYEKGIFQTHYISNHDQDNPKSIGIVLDGLENVTIDFSGSTLLFHGKMIPFVVKNCVNCTIKNVHIDFVSPSIVQAEILTSDPESGMTIRIDSEHDYTVENGRWTAKGFGWQGQPGWGIVFDGATRHMVYRTSDLGGNLSGVTEISPRVLRCPNWKDARLTPGCRFAFRCGGRPAPAIFLYQNKNTTLENVQIHFAEGMGVLGQLCDGIHLDGLSVCLRGENDSRYFTTQADATHFSGCKGMILSENGLYEGMTDDAINVHGTYLKVIKRIDDRTLQARYMHDQAWGFHWGDPGDKVNIIRSNTMEIVGKGDGNSDVNEVESIKAVDKPVDEGVRVFEIRFKYPVPEEVTEAQGFGIENLTWTPEVIFRKNVVRNNRARGALFSTPKKTIVEDNLFDHTSGTAILLCGDCNGWYETGACRNVVIRRNRFINSLTNMFQFTNAVISIYPEIPNLAGQKQYFHGGSPDAILIEENVFDSFDRPLVYAKSVDGLTFRKNRVTVNNDFPAFHWNKHRFFFQHVKNAVITDDNYYEDGFDAGRDLRQE